MCVVASTSRLCVCVFPFVLPPRSAVETDFRSSISTGFKDGSFQTIYQPKVANTKFFIDSEKPNNRPYLMIKL